MWLKEKLANRSARLSVTGKRARHLESERWAALCGLLEIEPACDGSIRYQLLHRTASALLEARRFCARGAAVIVHSFGRSCDGFGDFQHFVKLMGGFIKAPGTLVAVPPREGIELFFGWAQGPVFSDTPSP